MEHRRRRGLLSNGQYLRLLSASGISSVGDGILIVALPLIARTLTSSSRSIAAVFAVGRLPVLLLSFGGAALADRSDARRTMIVADLVRAAVLLAVAIAAINDSLTLVALYVTAFVLGLFEVPFSAASQRMIPSTVTNDQLPAGNAQLGSAQISGEQFVGPAIGGQLMAIGSAAPLIGDAASFLLSAACLRGLQPLPPRSTAERGSIFAEIAEGLRWFRGNRTLRIVTSMVALLAFAQAMVNALLVPLAIDVLRLSSRTVGLFVASIAVGNVVGSIVAPRVLSRVGYGLCIVVMVAGAGIGYGGIGFTTNAIAVVGLMIGEGIAIMIGQVAYNVLRQRLIPMDLIGRVYTTTRVLIRGAAPFGALIGGEIAQRNGTPAAMLVAGVLCLVSLGSLGPALLATLRDIRP